MIKGVYATGRSLVNRMKNLETIANNIANINTTGYKRQVPFIEVLNSNTGEVKMKQLTDFTQGEMTATSNPLDMAITGNGYFTVEGEQGIELTRNGRFKLDTDGYLVNEQGYRVLGKNGEINFSQFQLGKDQTVTIGRDGTVKVGEFEAGKLRISKLDKESVPERGDGLNFTPDDYGILPAEENDFEVRQGYLEGSNVNPVLEMEEMIQKNTEYDSAHKIMNFLDKSLQDANEIGKT